MVSVGVGWAGPLVTVEIAYCRVMTQRSAWDRTIRRSAKPQQKQKDDFQCEKLFNDSMELAL
jgi:hypothetical protein